jgi:hypothetical protein
VPNPIDDIRQEMAQIRRELYTDVSGVVDIASRVFDWRGVVRRHPWKCLGASFVVGYMLVPRRNRTDQVPSVQVQEPLSGLNHFEAPGVAEQPGLVRSMAHWGWRLFGPIAIQAAQTYAAYLIEDALVRSRSPARPPRNPVPGARPNGADAPARPTIL